MCTAFVLRSPKTCHRCLPRSSIVGQKTGLEYNGARQIVKITERNSRDSRVRLPWYVAPKTRINRYSRDSQIALFKFEAALRFLSAPIDSTTVYRALAASSLLGGWRYGEWCGQRGVFRAFARHTAVWEAFWHSGGGGVLQRRTYHNIPCERPGGQSTANV